MGNSAIKFIEIDEPQTAAEADHQRKAGRSKVTVAIRLSERIGGLRSFKARTTIHEQAAFMFICAYEKLHGWTNSIVDPTQPIVDRSKTSHDGGMAHRIDADKLIRLFNDRMSKHEKNILTGVILLDAWKDLAREPERGTDWEERRIKEDFWSDELKPALDKLAVLFELAS